MTPARPGIPLSASTSSDQNSVERSLIRTHARLAPDFRYSTTSARASGLRAGSTASSMSSTIWSARDSWALSKSSVRAPLTSSHERAIPGSTFLPLCTRPLWCPRSPPFRPGVGAPSGGGAGEPVEQPDVPVDVDPPTAGTAGTDEVQADQLRVAARPLGVGPEQREVVAPVRPLGAVVQCELQLDGRGLPVEVAQALGLGGRQLAVVGVPHPEHVGRRAQDEPAHRQPEVVG